MQKDFEKILIGYEIFRQKYASSDQSILQHLSNNGQRPEIMVVACCDSRVDPALMLQCDPGDLFVVRNVANIVPPYEKDAMHHGTSAALEFGICGLEVKHLILLGHTQCGGIRALMDNNSSPSDFISNWVSIVKPDNMDSISHDDCARAALNISYKNCLTFPWIVKRIEQQLLTIHLWFFDIKSGQIYRYSEDTKEYISI